jgi:hypothetical protein
VTHDAADYCASRRSQQAAAENITRDAAHAGTDRGTFVLLRHTGATAEADQYRCRNCTD